MLLTHHSLLFPETDEDSIVEQGREAIESFLKKKWEKEGQYRLKKKLFAFEGNRIAVQFWYTPIPTYYPYS